MHVVLIGADFEENLGVGMIGAAAQAAGHRVTVVPFAEAADTAEVAGHAAQGDVIGLSIQFQHRAHEFLALAGKLRANGFSGHITCGGQYPTLAAEELLARHSEVDSVVLHEGELSFVELLAALAAERPLTSVAGLVLRDADGNPQRGPNRPLLADLDTLPHALRYRPHARHADVPFIPIMGARGCWGRCAFCSITSFYRDARARGGGKLLRHRSPEDVGDEMAALCEAAGGRAIFCFHDDNFLLPQPAASIARVRAIRAAFDTRCPNGEIALIGKCRPDSLTLELAHALRAAGVIRLYVGVENISERGATNLLRGMDAACVRAALTACREAGIFSCYNLLVYEPDATLDDVAENLAFAREHATHPFNFGRVEAYLGTTLQRGLARSENLTGSHLGHGYRIADDRTELAFRISAAVFAQRNWEAAGVHNRLMGIGYTATLLEHFHPADEPPRRAKKRANLDVEARKLTRDIVVETTDFWDEALSLARELDPTDYDRIARETALLGLRIAEADRWRHAQLDQLYAQLESFAKVARAQPKVPKKPRFLRATRTLGRYMAVGSLLASLGGAGCDDGPGVVDPDAGPLDMPVGDADARPLDRMAVDPDARPLDMPVGDADAAPLDQGHPKDAGVEVPVVDPLPPDGAVDASNPADAALTPATPDAAGEALAHGTTGSTPVGGWRNTAAAGVTRSTDLPLYDPPTVKLRAIREPGGAVRVSFSGGPASRLERPAPVGTRWQSAGLIEGDGSEVLWTPESSADQLDVAVRTLGGITVVSLRAGELG